MERVGMGAILRDVMSPGKSKKKENCVAVSEPGGKRQTNMRASGAFGHRATVEQP